MIDSRRKAFIFLAIAFVLAIITALVVINQVQSAQQALSQTTSMPVADEDIPTYTEITSEMIDWVDVPVSDDSEGFAESTLNEDQILDSIVTVNLSEGDLITPNILRPQVDVPDDHRVVWLNSTDNVVLDQAVAEGDIIDIIVTDEDEEAEMLTTRSYEDVQVVQTDIPDEEEQEDGGESAEPAIKVSMDIEDAENFIHMQHTAEYIRVLLSNQVQQADAEEIEPQDEEEVEEIEEEEDDEEDDEDEDEDDD